MRTLRPEAKIKPFKLITPMMIIVLIFLIVAFGAAVSVTDFKTPAASTATTTATPAIPTAEKRACSPTPPRPRTAPE